MMYTAVASNSLYKHPKGNTNQIKQNRYNSKKECEKKFKCPIIPKCAGTERQHLYNLFVFCLTIF